MESDLTAVAVPESPKLRTRVAPNDLCFIVRADERLAAFLELESVLVFHNQPLRFIPRGQRRFGVLCVQRRG